MAYIRQTIPYGRFLTLLSFTLALLSLLAIGLLRRQQQFLTQGILPGLPEPISEGEARMGVNVDMELYDDAALAENLRQIQETGIQYVKQSFYFSESFDWESSDRLVSTVSAHDLILVPLLDGNPENSFAPVETAVFAQWAGEFAGRYGDHLRYYIIWDEPNLMSHWGDQPPNPIEYGALLTAASQTIKAADPDALIIAAPLAPTVEAGPKNLAEWLFLQELYQAGAGDTFDIVAGKPYGFSSPPDDRTVAENMLNFSRIILMREVMEQNSDGDKAIWAGNWGWNNLPPGWAGLPSIWGEPADESQRAEWTIAAYQRARQEWPWMGVMFLENWQPNAPADDPRWGFSIAGRETVVFIKSCLTGFTELTGLASSCQSCKSCPNVPTVAYPGFHLASPNSPAQVWQGGWEFSPEFGADISQRPEDVPGDQVTFTFWGTDVGLRVRRANFRARLYVTVDGQPANALPADENGTTLILTSAGKTDDYVATEWVARDLPPGVHTLEVVTARGWDQWALNGFSVAYHPPNQNRWVAAGLGVAAVLCFLLTFHFARQAEWGKASTTFKHVYLQLSDQKQVLITAVLAALVALTGWLTWGEEAAGLYRRLGDGSQLILTAGAALLFYIAPSFFLFLPAVALLFVLIYFRPAWGLALIALCFPFYAWEFAKKPILHLNFSLTEILTLVTFTAVALRNAYAVFHRPSSHARRPSFHAADYTVLAFFAVATLSLLFTKRLDVATNEWRLVILEPALFYFSLRAARLTEQELWVVLDAFVLSGVVVAAYGLWQYVFRPDELITAEGGLLRLRSFYGSPNNVGLYLGRVIPLLAAIGLMGTGRRRWVYSVVLLPISLALVLTFSKGALFLGIPAALLFVFWQWQRINGRSTWPWLVVFGVMGVVGLFVAQQIPALAARLDLNGATGVFRLNLWRASLNMFANHPWFGVGLDNFLYEYRSRYIFDAAWREPNLNHPHNILLDFATRLGLLGLLAGVLMIGIAVWTNLRIYQLASRQVQHSAFSIQHFPLAVALGGILVDMLVHGLVDHSFFLVDLAFVFYLVMGTAVWLERSKLSVNSEQ